LLKEVGKVTVLISFTSWYWSLQSTTTGTATLDSSRKTFDSATTIFSDLNDWISLSDVVNSRSTRNNMLLLNNSHDLSPPPSSRSQAKLQNIRGQWLVARFCRSRRNNGFDIGYFLLRVFTSDDDRNRYTLDSSIKIGPRPSLRMLEFVVCLREMTTT